MTSLFQGEVEFLLLYFHTNNWWQLVPVSSKIQTPHNNTYLLQVLDEAIDDFLLLLPVFLTSGC